MKGENTMKKLPEVDVGFREMYRMLVTPIRSKLLVTEFKSGQRVGR